MPATGYHAGMQADAVLDIRALRCPMTFVRVRLALDALEPGQTVLVTLGNEESRRRVPATVREQGHAVVEQWEDEEGTLRLLVRKKE